MRAPMVSVIIPVYKAEDLLEECLNSVLGQDYPALEVILVDDGSPDRCPEICDRYAEGRGSVKALHQSNRGPGMARNAGLEAASGEYIAFVDADDCLDGAGAVRRLVEEAEKKQADITVGAYRLQSGRGIGAVRRHGLRDGGYTETVDFRFRGFSLSYLSFPWGKLYRRRFLTDRGLRYREYPFSEDKLFNMTCCVCQPVYAFVEQSVYLYRMSDGSLTHRYQQNYRPVWIGIASQLEELLARRGIAEEYGDLTAFHLCIGLVFVAAQELAHKRGLGEAVRAMSEYGGEPLVRKAVKELSGGRYIRQLEQRRWRAAIWGAAVLCRLRAYLPLALGTWVSMKLRGATSPSGPCPPQSF